MDGTLTGQAGTILGYNAYTRSGRVDQGTSVADGPCTLDATLKAHRCVPGHDEARYPRGPGRPVAGLFGDPQLFVLESRDSDNEDRNFSPVKLTDQQQGPQTC